MTDKFTEEQILAAGFRVSIENNALLRIVLANQVKIMEKLKIDIEVTEDVYKDLLPGETFNTNSEVSLLYRAVEPMARLIQKRAWEWVQMNTDITDSSQPQKDE